MRRGRPPLPRLDPATLDTLTIPQVLAYLRQVGRTMGRAKLQLEIASGRLPVLVDRLHLDCHRQPRLLVERSAVDRWLKASLTPLRVSSLAS